MVSGPNTTQSKNLLDELIRVGKENKLVKEMERVEECIAKVRTRHGVEAAKYLGFDTFNWNNIRFSGEVEVIIENEGSKNSKYIGEWST